MIWVWDDGVFSAWWHYKKLKCVYNFALDLARFTMISILFMYALYRMSSTPKTAAATTTAEKERFSIWWKWLWSVKSRIILQPSLPPSACRLLSFSFRSSLFGLYNVKTQAIKYLLIYTHWFCTKLSYSLHWSNADFPFHSLALVSVSACSFLFSFSHPIQHVQ